MQRHDRQGFDAALDTRFHQRADECHSKVMRRVCLHHSAGSDQSNIRELERRAPAECNTEPQLILGYIQTDQKDVPDPYYGGAEDFELVLDLIEEACIEFLKRVFSKNRLS